MTREQGNRGRGRSAELNSAVSQAFNLRARPVVKDTLPTASRRYSRLKICATSRCTRALNLRALSLIASAVVCLVASSSSGATPAITPQYGAMPIYFEANQGQVDEPVDFVARGRDHTIYLSGAGALVALRERGAREESDLPDRLQMPVDGKVHFVRVSLHGGNSKAEAAGQEPFAGRVNYLLGKDPSAWRTDVPTYAKVHYSEVYPGVDVVYYANDRQLEYDFVAAPGADPSLIELHFEGADQLEIDANGDLVLRVGKGQLRHHKPVIHQTVKGFRREIEGGYRLKDKQTVVFALGAYDRTQPLVIDPMLSYSTFLGGSQADSAWAVAADAQGSAYIAGDTLSVFRKLPLSGEQTNYGGGTKFGGDAFVAKLDFDGTNTLIGYLTYLGGNSLDGAVSIALDSAGAAYVTGYTLSTNFPVVGAAFQPNIAGTNDPVFKVHSPDAFVTKLDTNGHAIYSTYLGGEFSEVGAEIAVDTSGNAYVVGYTDSALIFRATNWVQTTRCTNVVACTNSVCVTNESCGATVSKTNTTFVRLIVPNFVVTNVSFKKFPPTVTTTNSTQTNTTTTTFKTIVDTTTFDYERLTLGFPIVNGFQTNNHGAGNVQSSDLFIAKLDPNGSNLVFSTYLGGSGSDLGTGIAVDSAGNVVVSGWTASTDFPVTNAIQPFNGGLRDAVVAKFDATGTNLLYSTYLGGVRDDLGYRVAVDAAGAAYVTGPEGSTDFPSTPGARNRGGLFASTNVGATWDLSSSGLTHGTINAFAADPINTGTFYAGTARGVFKSIDSGASWSTINTGLFSRAVLSLSVDPSAADTVYAGTGAGLYVSTNGGLRWQAEGDSTVVQAGVTTTFLGLDVGLPSTAIRSIYVNPLDSTNVLVATAAGVYSRSASTNATLGMAWTQLNSGLKSRSVFALAVHPTLPALLFAATDGGIYVSTNRGTNWRSSSSGLITKRTRALVIDPATPSTLYAGTLRGFHKSINGGTNWFILTNGLGRPAINAILIDPAQPSTLYVGATNGLFKSTDGGNNWVASGTGLQTLNVSTLAFDPNVAGALLAGTRSTNFAGGSNDVFLAKLAPDGSALEYALSFGGNRGDEGWAVAVDSSGSAFVTGFTLSRNFPVTNAVNLQTNFGGRVDAFVAQVDSGGTNLVFSTYLGGHGRDAGQGIALDGTGYLYVVGRTQARGFPTTNNTVQAKFGDGRNDAFVTRFLVGPPGPYIQTAFFGAEVVVSWRAVSSELVLESRELGDGAWVPVAQKPTLAGGRYSVRLPNTSTGRLFRLRAEH